MVHQRDMLKFWRRILVMYIPHQRPEFSSKLLSLELRLGILNVVAKLSASLTPCKMMLNLRFVYHMGGNYEDLSVQVTKPRNQNIREISELLHAPLLLVLDSSNGPLLKYLAISSWIETQIAPRRREPS